MYEKSLKGPVIYIRHAESIFNQVMHDPKNMYLKNSRQLVDCGITDLGISQCENLAKSIQECKVKTVFISPLNRTIETCYHTMKEHPDFESIKFIILPLASEIIDSSCDIPMSLEEKKMKFSSYKNYNIVWDFYRDFYHLDNIDEPNFQQILKEIDFSDYDQNYGLYEKGLDICLANNKSAESVKHLYLRSVELKKYLKNFLVDYPLEDNERILIFTHSAISRVSTSTSAQYLEVMDDFPEDCLFMKNCEFITMNLD